MTPDSSRYWPQDKYRAGGAQPSFDKQFVRDHLEAIQWNKQPPVPSLPDEVVARTRAKYLEAYPPLDRARPGGAACVIGWNSWSARWWTRGSATRTRSANSSSHFIARVVRSCEGNLGKAASTLGVHRNTLTRKLQELKIRRAR